jgi:hypothetical protein
MEASEMEHVSPVVFKRQAAWDGIRLEHFRFRKGELPEHAHREHLITLPLGDVCNGEIRTTSGFRAQGATKESVCVRDSFGPALLRTPAWRFRTTRDLP